MPSSDPVEAASAPQGASSLLLDDDATTQKHGALVSSWIRNEGQCVTVSHLSLNLGVSRTRACEMLEREALAVPNDEGQLRATRCHLEATTIPTNSSKSSDGDAVPCTVFKLVSGDASASAETTTDPNATTTLYALSLQTSESVHVAHERDMAHCRDVLASNPRALLVVSKTAAIAPSPEMQALWTQSLEGAASSNVAAAVGAGPTDPSSSASAKVVRTKTTASSFFRGSKSNTSSKTTTAAAAAATPSQTAATKPKLGTSGVRSSLSVAKAKSEDEKENKESAVGAKRAETNRLSNPAVAKSGARSAATKTNAKVGNADDFVGDMDTESDEEEDDVVMANRDDDDDEENAEDVPVRKQSAPKAQRSRNRDDSDDEEEDVGRGAPRESAEATKSRPMDDFVLSSNAGKSAASATTTRRRKRVVERTFKDEHGYLQTELQEIWEDVPVEETQAKTATAASSSSSSSATSAPSRMSSAPKPPAKKATGKTAMKQGSLMGFFAKK